MIFRSHDRRLAEAERQFRAWAPADLRREHQLALTRRASRTAAALAAARTHHRAFLGLAIVSTAIVLFAIGMVVKTDAYVVRPGVVSPTASVIDVTPASTDTSGSHMITVDVRQLRWIEQWYWKTRDDAQVMDGGAAKGVEGGLDHQHFLRDWSVQVASFVAARERDPKVRLEAEGVFVEDVFPGTPAHAAGMLRGDRVERVAGRRVRTDFDVGTAMDTVAKRGGQQVSMVVVRGAERRTLTLGTRYTPQGPPDILGAVMFARKQRIVGADVRRASIPRPDFGGHSAGLSMALALHQLNGKDVAAPPYMASAALGASGRVLPLGVNVEMKAIAAADAGVADSLLVAVEDAEHARRGARGRIEVVPVATYGEAVRWLQRRAAASAGATP